MKKIPSTQKYGTAIFLLSGSKIFERMGHYAFTGILFALIANEAYGITIEKMISLNDIMLYSLVFSSIVGGLIGDLALGHKNASILGAILQGIGFFTICFPSPLTFYLGFILAILGSGLYTANSFAMVGSSYENKPQSRDAGFTFYYACINIGALLYFLPSLLFGDKNYVPTLIYCGIAMFISIIPLLFINRKPSKIIKLPIIPFDKRVLNIIFALGLTSFFWMILQLGEKGMDPIINFYDFELSANWKIQINVLGGFITTVLALIAFFVWSTYYVNAFKKMLIAFLTAILAYAVWIYPSIFSIGKHELELILYFILIGITETLLIPTLYAYLSRYASKKYLATIMGMLHLPFQIFPYFTGYIVLAVGGEPLLILLLCISFSLLTAMGILIFNRVNKKQLSDDDLSLETTEIEE